MAEKDDKGGGKGGSALILSAVILWLCIFFGLMFIDVITFKKVHPIPLSVRMMYMILATVGIFNYISIFDADLKRFFGPIGDFLGGKAQGGLSILRWPVLILLPLLIGYNVYAKSIPNYDAPMSQRTIHPAPPTEFAGLSNPFPWTEENIAVGKGVFTAFCSPCHGPNLDGGGPAAAGFTTPPANFRDPGTIAQLQESFLFWRIKKGGIGLPVEGQPWNTVMPRWEGVGRKGEVRLPDDVIWKIIMWEYTGTGHKPRTWE